MRAYLIEDDSLKSDKLIAFLKREFSFLEVSIARSFQSGLQLLASATPELVLLDMRLPTFDSLPQSREGRQRPLGGYDLMRKIKRGGMQCPVIIVTQLDSFGDGNDEVSFHEISQRCKREFPGMFFGSVYFPQTSSAWEGELAALILSVFNKGAGNADLSS